MIRRAEVATRAGTVISLRRIVAVVALAICGSVRLAAARVRLNAMTACPRWVLSAATVSRIAASVVVKNAWNRHTSNRVS